MLSKAPGEKNANLLTKSPERFLLRNRPLKNARKRFIMLLRNTDIMDRRQSHDGRVSYPYCIMLGLYKPTLLRITARPRLYSVIYFSPSQIQ